MSLFILVSEETKGMLRSRLLVLSLVFMSLFSAAVIVINNQPWRGISPLVFDSMLISLAGSAVFSAYMTRDIMNEGMSNAYEPFIVHGVSVKLVLLAKVLVFWLASLLCSSVALLAGLLYGVESGYMLLGDSVNGFALGLAMAIVICTTAQCVGVLSASVSREFFSSIHVSVALQLGVFLLLPLSLMYELPLVAAFIISLIISAAILVVGIRLVDRRVSRPW